VNYRQLGATNLRVSEIGFGAWGIGGATPGPTSYGKTDDITSLAALESALAAGVNFFDTSNVYGYGHSERLIGQAFAHRRKEIIIATKAGFVDYESPPDFSANAILKSADSSLARLNTDYIDLLQLHNPSADWLKEHPSTLLALSRLQDEGKVRALGISIKQPADAFALLELFPFQVVQANFNMLDIRVVASGLLQKLNDLGAGLIGRTPLAFGFLAGVLTGEEAFDPKDHRSRWSREQIRLWAMGARDLLACCKESFESPAYQVALRFCLSYPQVSTTIAGMLTPAEVASNVLASEAGPLSLESCARIEALHKTRQFFVN
jgi:aryl-alcohol dehydrogenase-like predicted oxidoreductase